MNKILEFAFVLGVCAFALAAMVEATQGTKAQAKHTITVRYDDLNLETDQGVKRLYGRLRNAAHEVCGVQAGLVALELRTIEMNCVRGAIANAVKKVNRPQLTAFHRTNASVKNQQLVGKL
jgi:UrcA family protein